MSETLSGYSVYTLIGDGVTTNFPIQFSLGTLRDDSVKVSVEGEVDGEGNQVYRTWERVIGDPGVMRVHGSPPGNGKVITFARKIVRDTLLHQYANGSVLNYPSLDESHLQLLMLCQELFDGLGLENVQTNINMTNHTITGLAVDESNPTSAATVGWTKELRDRAEQAAQQAVQSADASRASAEAAAGFAANAANSEDNSAASAELARRWASEDEDVVVLDGKYSAYHHAQKAADKAADAAYDAQRAEDAADRAEAAGGPATMDMMGIVTPKTGGDSGLLIASPGKLEVVPATTDKLGGVRVGEGIAVKEDGTISVPPPPEINLATNTTAGTVIVGEGLDIAAIVEEGQETPPTPGTLSLAAHASEDGEKYGRGNFQFFGHVRLTDDFEQTDATAEHGIGLSAAGAKTLWDRLLGFKAPVTITSSRDYIVPETANYNITVVGGGGTGGRGGDGLKWRKQGPAYYRSGGGGGGGGAGETVTRTLQLTKGDVIRVIIGGAGGSSAFGGLISARGGGNGHRGTDGSRAGVVNAPGGAGGFSYGTAASSGGTGQYQTGGGGGVGGISLYEGTYGNGGAGGAGGSSKANIDRVPGASGGSGIQGIVVIKPTTGG